MKVLITGAAGQLGRGLARTLPSGMSLTALDRERLDLSRPGDIDQAVARERPDLIVNAAAYTAVDRAESEPETAHAINADAPGRLARAARAHGARLVHISTDFVFDGERGRPWMVTDPPRPLGVYGASKLAGERRVLAAAPDALVLRTAWLYGGPDSFVRRMLDLLGRAERVEAVIDQVGAPTWVESLCRAIWAAAERPEATGIHHWTDAGVASRYDLVMAIQEEAMALGLLRSSVPVRPVSASRFPAPAARPAFSVLDLDLTRTALGLEPVHWRQALRAMLTELAGSGR